MTTKAMSIHTIGTSIMYAVQTDLLKREVTAMCNTIQRGDIYYCDFYPVVGSEQSGCRPAIVIQNNVGNQYSPTTIVAPITSKPKKWMPTHVQLRNRKLINGSIVLLEHIRTIDKSRLKTFVCKASEYEMEKIDTAIGVSLGTGKGD